MINSPLFDVQLHVSPAEESDAGRPRRSICVVVVSGEVDLATAPELGRVLAKAILSDCREVLVDMARVEFIDAAGIGALVTGARAAVAAGTHLQLRAASAAVEKVLRLVGLDGAIENAAQPAEAAQAGGI